MTSKHTPGPWHIGAMESGQAAIDAANGSEVTGWLDPDDARRIVACVNACAGLDTEYLEAVGLPEFAGKQLCADMVQQELDAVIAQRDHWKANHENQVRRARILMERPDMPIERVAAYKRMLELEQQRDQMLAALEHIRRRIPHGGFAQIHDGSATVADIDAAITKATGGAE